MRQARKNTKRRALFGLLIRIVVIVCILFLITRFVLALYRQEGNNMFPSVRDGDLCFILKTGDPVKDEVVLWRGPDGQKRLARIVAVQGQQITMSGGRYMVDGYVPPETVLYDTDPAEEADIAYPYSIPDGQFFLLNDYRDEKTDSRMYGAVDRNHIIGRLVFLFRRRGF